MGVIISGVLLIVFLDRARCVCCLLCCAVPAVPAAPVLLCCVLCCCALCLLRAAVIISGVPLIVFLDRASDAAARLVSGSKNVGLAGLSDSLSGGAAADAPDVNEASDVEGGAAGAAGAAGGAGGGGEGEGVVAGAAGDLLGVAFALCVRLFHRDLWCGFLKSSLLLTPK